MMSRPHQRGSILLFVLFLAGVLGVLAAIGATAMKAAVDSSRGYAERVRSEEAMRGAIEYIIGQSGANIRQSFGTAIVQVGRAKVFVTVRDEAARIDLNLAPLQVLAGILRQVGVAENVANVYAARIVDWRDNDDMPSSTGGAERPAYRAAGRLDGPRNGRFLSTGELALVLGMPLRVAEALGPYVTVASGRSQINPMFADPPVLLALPGSSAQGVRKFLDERSRPNVPFRSLISSLGQVQDFVTEENGFAVRFEGRVETVPDHVRSFEAVVSAVPGDVEPYRVLAWDPSPPPRIQNLP